MFGYFREHGRIAHHLIGDASETRNATWNGSRAGACAPAIKFAGVEVQSKNVFIIAAWIIDHPLKQRFGLVLLASGVEKPHNSLVTIGCVHEAIALYGALVISFPLKKLAYGECRAFPEASRIVTAVQRSIS